VKADLTRSTFRPEKHYRAVRMQQGRVQLDADWNEQADIGLYLDETTRVDVIGRCGAPIGNAGFGVGVTPDAADLTLTPGRLYGDGVLCELESTPIDVTVLDADGATLVSVVADGRELGATDWVALSAKGVGPVIVRLADVDSGDLRVGFSPPLDAAHLNALNAGGDLALRRVTTYTSQPQPHDDVGGKTKPEAGTYVVFLDQWERLRTALDDADLREPALGGPDSATRAQTVWQVRLHRLGDVDADVTCASVPDLASLFESTARLRTRTQAAPPVSGPCLVPDAAGYRGLENQLYRVEIHDGGALGEATFKWSRENGSVVTAWLGQNGSDLTVGSLGRDANLGIKPGDWVELTDDAHELRGEPGTVVRVASTKAPATITIEQPATPVQIADFSTNARVRRWDDPAGLRTVEAPAANEGYLASESGIEWRFEGDTFVSGDHWQFPARTGVGLGWPADSAGNGLAKPPDGIRHHYCALAIVRLTEKWEMLDDCRKLFPPLTSLAGDAVHVTRIRTQAQETLRNDTEVTTAELLSGIEILCDGNVTAGTLVGKPTCLVTIDLPYPVPGEAFWNAAGAVGTIPITVQGTVSAHGGVIRWRPTGRAIPWLQKGLPNALKKLQFEDRLLVHLTLKGNFVYAAGAPTRNVDGETFGLLTDNVLDAQLPSGDGRRGGDLELWYWLVPHASLTHQVALAANLGSHILNTPVRRSTTPLAIGFAATREPLKELLPPTFELDPEAVVDVEKAHQLLIAAELSGAKLRTAVEEPLVPLAERLNDVLHANHLALELDIVPVGDFSTILVDLAAQGLDLVLAADDTLDDFDETQRAAFKEVGRVLL
jgi:hypothetical protein